MPKASKRKPCSARDMKDASDNPEWTKETFAKAKPFQEAFPDLAATIRRRGAQKAPIKKAISIRLDVDILNSYRKTGDGWQSRINDDLRKARELA